MGGLSVTEEKQRKSGFGVEGRRGGGRGTWSRGGRETLAGMQKHNKTSKQNKKEERKRHVYLKDSHFTQ